MSKSMIRDLLRRLRFYEEEYKTNPYVKMVPGTIGVLHEAADTIGDITAEVAGQNGLGWIPVDERLPEDGKIVLVWYEYFRYGEYNCMFQTYGIGYQFDGHWSGDVSGTKARCIAWQPLPPIYEQKEE